MKLERRYVEKPWGRTVLPPIFSAPSGKRIGEVWFTGAGDQPLLVKYLFTSERLSIQVHPSDEQARSRGLARGKSECWYILEAEPGATLGLGLKHKVSHAELRSAALDGSIEQLLDWRPIRAGDFFMVPPGTIHAIGGGVTLLEFQQNADLTYRLYDYGSGRELHLDEGVEVATAGPYPDHLAQHVAAEEQRTLVDGPKFVLIHSTEDQLHERSRWVIPLEGKVEADGEEAVAGECILLPPGQALKSDGRMLIGASC